MHKTIVIAEIGSNHCGSFYMLQKTIDAAREAGADLIKLQAWDTDKFISKERAEETYYKFKKYEIPKEWYKQLKAKDIFFTPFNIEMVDFLEKKVDPPLYKISSGDFTYKPLIDRVLKTNKQLFISSGGATVQELVEAVDYFYLAQRRHVKKAFEHIHDWVILHCVVSYPANRGMLGDYDFRFKGYSDHTKTFIVPCLAVALGAQVIEKHFKLKDCDSPDNGHSLTPDAFKRMIAMIRGSEFHLQHGKPYPEEEENLKFIRRGSDGMRPL